MSDRDEQELRIEQAKKRMEWDSERYGEPTTLEYLRYYRSGIIAEIHIEAVIDQVATRRAAEAVGLTETDRFDRLTAVQKKRLIEYHTDCLRRLQPTKGSKDD